MAMRDLKDLQQWADQLSPIEQLELARYLLKKANPFAISEEALLTEAVLAKDWLRPEEDVAWANL